MCGEPTTASVGQFSNWAGFPIMTAVGCALGGAQQCTTESPGRIQMTSAFNAFVRRK